MASAFQIAWQNALEAEKLLLNSLKEKESTFAEIAHFVAEFRTACQTAVLEDFETARSLDVEARLWDAHLKINTRFRKLLARHRDESGKKRPVERRKLEKHYLDFIKSSQRFYRGYIQHLSAHFGGIPELERVAQKFNFESLSVQTPILTPESVRKRILQSCHATLIRLGDLSRYRETELIGKDRNWGPAIGYYDLAAAINPASGASHNQLAVIALADGNHLRATYHLYRALAALEPHPSAKGNLEIEFKKIKNAWSKGELIRKEDAGIPGRALGPWFAYLHAQCYKGLDFPEHDELESEVLNQLAVDLKERSLEATLQKFCLVNIAAEDVARTRAAEDSVSNAVRFFQRINVKTFFTLLQILLAELERLAVEDSDESDTKTKPEKVTVVARRILPALRHYSSWLLITSPHLAAFQGEKESPLSIQIKEFWSLYANTLTLLTSTFDVVRLPEIEYLLEEDEDTLGFAPLAKEATARRYMDVRGIQKPRIHDPGVERSHPNMEMLYRIREFVIDGLDLVVSNKIPVALIDDHDRKTFLYQEEGLPSQVFASPPGHQHALSTASVEREDIPPLANNSKYMSETRSSFGGSQSASASMSANMTRIVEGVERLVDSDAYEDAPAVHGPALRRGDDSPTPPANTFEPSSYGLFGGETPQAVPAPTGMSLGLPTPMQRASTSDIPPAPSWTPRPALPGIPSIWNTALTPQGAGSSTPKTPPGLGQHPIRPLSSGDGSIRRDRDYLTGDLTGRSNAMAPSSLGFSHDGSAFIQSPWTYTNQTTASNKRLSGANWEGERDREKEILDGPDAYFSSFNPQRVPSSLANASWANNAFVGSSLSSGLGLADSEFNSGRKSVAQLGAIGQTPPCGQGG